MADNIVKRGFEEFDRGTIENIAEYLSPEELYSDVIDRVRKYHPSDDISLIEKGYEVARKAHEGQKRKSGEPYIIHPLYVALILADLELDKETITAGLLHDVVEFQELVGKILVLYAAQFHEAAVAQQAAEFVDRKSVV